MEVGIYTTSASRFRCLLVTLCTPLLCSSTQAQFGSIFNVTPEVTPVISTGHVMARAQVLGPNGGPILVKVRLDGSSSEEVEEIGEAYAGGPLDGVYILSGAEYRSALQDLAELKATQPEILSRAEYLPVEQLQQGLLLADGSRTAGITLPDHIKTAVVKGREDRLGADLQSHILLRAPYQLSADTSLEEGISSLLMNRDGSIRATASGDLNGDSVETFTWRTAFYAEPDSYEQSEQRLDPSEDQIFGPIAGATLEQFGWFGTSYGITDTDGRFVVNSPLLCIVLSAVRLWHDRLISRLGW